MRVFRTTVSGTDSKTVFNCSGGTSYPLGSGFVFMEDTDLVVVRIAADGSETTLTLTTDYTVSGGSGATGTVTTVATYTDGQLVIYRDTSAIQSYDAEVGDGFDTDTFERQLDRMVMVIQEQSRRVESAVRFADSSTLDGDAVLPSPSPGKALIWNTEGTGFVNGGTSIGTGSLAVLETYAEAQALTGLSDGDMVHILSRVTPLYGLTNPFDGGGGLFAYCSGDYTTEVAADTQSGVYLPLSGDPTGAIGCLVRVVGEYVDCAWFGARGNNGSDATTAIQSAVTWAANFAPYGTATGKKVRLRAGEYLTSSTVTFPSGKPIVFEGEGVGSTKILRTDVTGGKVFTVMSSSTIRGLFFKGPGGGDTTGIYLLGANTAKVEDCFFQNQINGVELNGSYAVEITSCVFDVCYSSGVVAVTSAHNTMITRCNFFTCGVRDTEPAVYFTTASDNIGIKDNDFEYCWLNTSMVGCSSVEITGNYFEYHDAECFSFSSCYGVSISHNWIALGQATNGGDSINISNITGGNFRHNTVYNQSVAFDSATLVGFDVGMNKKSGTGTMGGAPWISPSFVNSWGQQTNYTAAGYIKDENGWVHLRGGVVGGTVPDVMFTLPSGYRPVDIAEFGTQSANGACRITVNPDGTVVPTVAASNNPCLDGISFYAG